MCCFERTQEKHVDGYLYSYTCSKVYIFNFTEE